MPTLTAVSEKSIAFTKQRTVYGIGKFLNKNTFQFQDHNHRGNVESDATTSIQCSPTSVSQISKDNLNLDVQSPAQNRCVEVMDMESDATSSVQVSQISKRNLNVQSPAQNPCVEVMDMESDATSSVQVPQISKGNLNVQSPAQNPSVEVIDMESDATSSAQVSQISKGNLNVESPTQNPCMEVMDAFHTDVAAVKIKNKHKTIFDPKWMEKFPWIKHDFKNHKDVLHCSLCIKHNKNSESPWVQNGCVSIRLDKIKSHEKSAAHMAAVIAETNASQNLYSKEEKQDSKALKAIEAAMKTLNFLIQHNLPHTTLFEPLINFCIEELHCSVLSPMRKAKNASYTSYHSVNEFLNVMSSVKEKEILKGVNESPCFAVLADETTDINNRKNMAVAVNYLKDGEPQTSFVRNSMLPDGKAETIFSELSQVITECGTIKKMSAFVSDGARAMVGKNEGVGVKLKRENSKIITMNCMNHRLSLATKDSFESMKRFLKVDEVLTSTYKYYKYSSSRTNSLINAQQIFAKEKWKTIKRVGFTRWLSHNEALNSIRSNYEAILADLENTTVKGSSCNLSGPDPSSLLKVYKNYEFFQAIHFLCDVLSVITDLNLHFQRKNSDLSSIEANVHNTLAELKKLKKKPGGTHCKRLEERARQLNIIAPIGATNGSFEDDARLFLDILHENVSQRLENLDIVSNLGILDLRKVPEDVQLSLYGNTQVMELADYFEMDENELMEEWDNFKTFYLIKTDIQRNLLSIPKLTSLMSRLNVTVGNRFPLLGQLLNIACTLPISNAEVERIFSQIKLVLTDNRNRLKIEQVHKLMILKLNGPCNYAKALEQWSNIKKRRMFH